MILAARRRLMSEVARLQGSGHASKLTANAEQLLTRWWAAAGWSARREILKTVEWLLRVETRRSHIELRPT